MKKLLLIVYASVLSAAPLGAQSGQRSVAASDIRLSVAGEYLTVSFRLDAGRRATPSGRDLVVSPVLRGGGGELSLAPVVVQGRRSKTVGLRHELATGMRRFEREPLRMAAGGSLDYTATVPLETWMRGGRLQLEGVSVGCCSAEEVRISTIAENILGAGRAGEATVVETPVVIPAQSTGEQLALRYPFIAPASELERIMREPAVTDYDMPLDLGRGTAPARHRRTGETERIVAATREGSISIYFAQGRHDIDRNFGGNNRNLVELISAVRALAAAADVRISGIVIAGFASPEGGLDLNERLANDRAVAVKQFLLSNSDIDPHTVRIYNGGVDWAGLRELIDRSDLYRRRRMIEIIDNTPVGDSTDKSGRLAQLRRLDNGRPYRYIETEFFPRLRQAAYIKVYYEPKTQQ
jgi:outer membrane protein OmpA-like peptidoglycan-associated protein